MPTQTTEKTTLTSARSGSGTSPTVFCAGVSVRHNATVVTCCIEQETSWSTARSGGFSFLEPTFGDLRVPHRRRHCSAAWKTAACLQNSSRTSQEVMANCENAGDFLRTVMEAMAKSREWNARLEPRA